MKIKAIIATLFVFASIQMTAQYLGNIQPGQRGYSPQPQTREAGEPAKPDVNLLSQEKANYYAELTGIDAFQKEVLKSYLKDYYEETVAIGFNMDIKYEDKRELINAEQKKLETTLKGVFTEEQVNTILAEEQIGDRKKNKKKKKKKTDKEG